VGFAAPAASWGAYPGHSIDDVQSGIGVVHNALLLENPERTVVRGPFRPSPRSLLNREFSLTPRPPWFVTNRTAEVTCRALTRFAARPSWAKLPGIMAAALRG
jgi:aldehyde dehydrogenase (NAD(P)+)